MQPLFSPQATVTFNDYFKLNVDIEDVLAYLGYTFHTENVTLPRSSQPLPWYDDLYNRIEDSLPYLSLTNETARREFLIAPVLLDLARHLNVRIRVEYPLEVSNQLKGTLDYYLRAEQHLLVIEAKNADLQRGFTQLATELIALDQWLDTSVAPLYGAVSIGNVWQFGILDRQAKRVTQDLGLYRVPADLKDLLAVLVAILSA